MPSCFTPGDQREDQSQDWENLQHCEQARISPCSDKEEGAQNQAKSPFSEKHRIIRKPFSAYNLGKYDVLLKKGVKTGKAFISQ